MPYTVIPVPTTAASRQWWCWMCGAMLVITAGYFAVPKGAVVQLYFLAVLTLSAAAVVLGIFLRRPKQRGIWIGLAAGLGFFAIGEAIYSWLDLVVGSPPYPSLADPFFLMDGVAFIIALWLLGRRRLGAADWASAIDAAMVAVGLGLGMWLLLLEPSRTGGQHGVAAILGFTYPMLQALGAVMAARVLFASGRRREPPMQLIVASMFLSLIVNVAYIEQVTRGAYQFGNRIDALWLLHFMMIAAAALHPGMGAISSRGAAVEPTASPLRFGILVLTALVAPAAVITQVEMHSASELKISAVVSAVVSVLLLLRMGEILRRLQASMRSLRASQQHRGRLLAHAADMAEHERKRVAVGLHDGPIQSLTAVAYSVALLGMRIGSGDVEGAAKLVAPVEQALSSQIDAMRIIMSALRPPVLDERGLQAALHDHVAGLQYVRDGMRVRCDVRLAARLHPSLEVTLYRIAQEFLANSIHHSRGGTITLLLDEHDHEVRLTITDDGLRLSADGSEEFRSEERVGVALMREHVDLLGGEWSLESTIGAGTVVTVTLPRVRSAAPA